MADAWREPIDWEAVARAEQDPLPGPAQVYTQRQCLAALMKGLERARVAVEWDGDDPLAILQTDLWTESVARSRQLLEEGLRRARGAGYFVSRRSTYGIDVSGFTCARAAGQLDANVAQADIRSLPFRPGSFDVIFDPSTIDHVPEEDTCAVIGQYHRALRPGGVVVLVFSHRTGTLRRDAGHSYFVFDPEVIKRELEDHGMRPVAEYAICCLNTQPAGILTSHRLRVSRLAYGVFSVVEYLPLSRMALGRLAPLWVIIAKKEAP